MHSRSHVVTLQFANLPDCAFVERGGPFVPRWELSPACEVSLACNLVNLTASLPPPLAPWREYVSWGLGSRRIGAEV